MRNAKEEFISNTYRAPKIICANISHNGKTFNLKKGHSLEDLETFLSCLDFEYDSGYGGQNLFGTIWFEDSTWSTRGEYDGSEWWETHKYPEIPEELK